ncbi:MAG: bifunctional 5,10-methylenetetrahydrofolate dehydrogenase/5,10-methenyltetrahydrofolate cyclohydrolase [Nanoarchaeota archaeon]|nr:bifunctional 5,10-methylenetetrahydrofolate dehydrogenase/5,10-methenyltetrahydrofolate cyclohydrolase [Nanoarchaeota archaeon]
MTASIIDGRSIAKEIRKQVKQRVKELQTQPGLAVVLVGVDPASKIYVKNKIKACEEVGFHSEVRRLDENATLGEVLEAVQELNHDPKVHGIIVQLPLPKQIDKNLIIDAILPYKDADGFSPINLGSMFADDNRLVPATPKGIITLIKSTNQELAGKHAVILGRSPHVGKAVATLLLQENCTVTICHSKTAQLESITKRADILVAAVGKPKMITEEMVKPGAIVIDVGINQVYDTLVGDVDFEEVKKVAGFITPVPGGVGPMTIASLLENTLICLALQRDMK